MSRLPVQAASASPDPSALPAVPISAVVPQGASAPEPSLADDLATAQVAASQAAAAAGGEPAGDPGQSAGDGSADPNAVEADPLLEFVASLPEGQALAGKYRTGYDFIQGAVNAQRLLGRRDTDAEMGRMIRERPEEAAAFIQQHMARQSPAQPQVAAGRPQSAPVPGGDVPEYRPEWRYMVEQDPETGMLRPKKGAPADIPAKLQRAAEYMEQRMAELAFRPQEALKPFLDPILQQVTQHVQQMVGSQVAGQQQRAGLQQWIDQNKNWMFVNGDPTGEETPAGRRLLEHVQEHIRAGVQDPAMALRFGMNAMQAEAATATRAKPAGRAAQAKANVAAPQRTAPDEDTLVQNESLEQGLLRKLRESRARKTG